MPEEKIALCQCGCGGNAGFWERSRSGKGIKKGDPKRYIANHGHGLGGDQRTLDERFWEKVDRCGPDECWEWQGAKGSGGYGHISDGGKLRSAHRVSYELSVGPVPEGMCVCHRCDNRPCVNPRHLFAGTHQDNMDDMARKGRNAQPKGEAKPNAKLTDADVRAIRSSPKPKKSLAEKYDIDLGTIYKIKARQAWSHVE